MDRRDLKALCAGAASAFALAWPLAMHAQQTDKMKRIGFLSSSSLAGSQTFRSCFSEGLAKLGWAEGQTVAIELRTLLDTPRPLPVLAEELIHLRPDLLFAAGTPAAQVMQRTVRDIPVVFAMVSDPVASGIVKSLARPEANVTGVSNFLPATTGKLLEFAKAIAPKATRVAFLYDPANGGKLLELKELRLLGPSQGVAIEPHELRNPEDIERAFAALTKSPPGALIIPTDGVTLRGMDTLVQRAAKLRRPAIYQTREFVDAGGLMSYGLNVCQHFRNAASHADKILKGAKPGDLPVELPTTFELIINLKTAKALGIKIPQSVLLRADRVIE